jgi:hypothetical protein
MAERLFAAYQNEFPNVQVRHRELNVWPPAAPAKQTSHIFARHKAVWPIW